LRPTPAHCSKHQCQPGTAWAEGGQRLSSTLAYSRRLSADCNHDQFKWEHEGCKNSIRQQRRFSKVTRSKFRASSDTAGGSERRCSSHRCTENARPPVPYVVLPGSISSTGVLALQRYISSAHEQRRHKDCSSHALSRAPWSQLGFSSQFLVAGAGAPFQWLTSSNASDVWW